MLSHSNVSGSGGLSYGPQTSPSTGTEGPMISIKSGQALASATVFDSNGRAVGVDVQLWRFPDGDGAPQLVSESTTDSTGKASLYDLSLSQFNHADPYVHYRLTATQFDSVDQSLPVKSATHDWSSLTKEGLVQTRTLTLKLQPAFVNPPHSSASSTTPMTVLPNNVKPIPQEQGCGATTTHILRTWTQVWTVIGEVHSTTGMTNHFEYSSGSGSSLMTMLAVGFNQWQAQSGVTKTNTIGWQSGWGTISSPTQSAYVKSMFDYQETYLDNTCHSWNYEIGVSAYDGGAQFGDHLSGDNSCPPIGAPYAGAPTGSSFTGSSSQSITYTNSVSLGGAYDSFGGTSDTVTLSDTTVYISSTLIQATFGTQHSTYYAYTAGGGVPTNTNLQVYFSNSGACGSIGISASPASLTFPSGSSGTSTITLTSQGGFADPVSLTTLASPSGSTVTFSPSSVTLVSGGSSTSTMTVSVATSLVGGSYSVSLSASNGDTSSSVTVQISIQDFTVSANPSFLTVYPGTSGTSTITLSSVNNYAGSVSLSVPNLVGITVSFSPNVVPVPSGGSATSSMTIIVSNSAPTGTYAITIAGTGSFASRTATVTVQVPDFSLSVSPSSVSIPVGQSASTSVSVTSLNNFAGTVFLSAPTTGLSGFTSSLSLSTLTLSPAGSATSTLTISTTSSVQTGNYQITVTGSSGAVSHNWFVSVSVTDFSISASVPAAATAGTSPSSTITVSALNGFAGQVSLSTTTIPAGLYCGLISPNTITGSGTANLSCSSSTAGSYTVTITGTTGTLSHSATKTFSFNDFSVSSNFNNNPPVNVNSQITYSVSVSGINGFSGTVSLSATMNSCQSSCTDGSPPVATWADTATSQTTAQPSSCASSTCTRYLRVTTYNAAGQFLLVLLGTCTGCGSGATSHTLSNYFWVQCNPKAGSVPSDFCMWAQGSSIAVPQNAIPGDAIYLDSNAGYSGTINLSTAVSACFNTCSSGTAPTTVWNDTRTTQTTALLDPTATSCIPGPYSYCNWRELIIYAGSQTGEFTVTVTGTCPSCNPAQTHTLKIDLSIFATGGGGGSVGAGTMITLADGSQIAAQNLKVGMQLLSYDLSTHQYVTTTITQFYSVVTHNQIEIYTSSSRPLIVDQNPAQKLYVQLPDGTVALISVTQLQVGYKLFDALSQQWTPITALHYQNGGNHVMYDIYTSAPGNYIANGILDPLKQ